MDQPTAADLDAQLDLARQAYLDAEEAGDLTHARRHYSAMDALLDLRLSLPLQRRP